MKYSTIATASFSNAREKGFYNNANPHGDVLDILGEVIEAHKALIRWGDYERDCFYFGLGAMCNDDFKAMFEERLKDSLPDELADIFLRTASLCGSYQLQEELDMVRSKLARCDPRIELANKSVECALCRISLYIAKLATKNASSIVVNAVNVMNCILDLGQALDVDIEWHIRSKMRYNKTRNFMHK